MRIVIAGANGLIGAALAQCLRVMGHEVIPAGRNAEAPGLRIDYTAMPDRAALIEALRGVDVLVNAVGIFRATADQSFDAVHVKGPVALFDAAVAAGVRRIVQVSALGADATSPLPYFASKGQADEALRALPIDSVIVRPSLVYAEQGASSRWFAQLAALPVTPLPDGGHQPIQPLHLDDLVRALAAAATRGSPVQVIEAVGPRALSLREYLALFRAAMGRPRHFIGVPSAWLRAPLRWLRHARAPLDPDALDMLARGSVGDAAAISDLLGHRPRDPAVFFDAGEAGPWRTTAVLAWLLPLMRHSLVIVWLVTAWVSVFVYPHAGSYRMLAGLGLHGAAATAALWSGAILDAVLGLALLLARRRTWIYRAQFVLIGGYTLLISIGLPEQWAHPFGPVLKNLPLLAMIVALHELDRPDGSDRR